MKTRFSLFHPARAKTGFLVLITLLSAGHAAGDVFEWSGASSFGPEFNDPDNWTLLSGAGPPPPGVNDAAEFRPAGSPHLVEIPSGASWSLDSILVDDSVATISGQDESSADYQLNLTSGAGDLEVDGGQLTLLAPPSGADLTATIADDVIVREGTLTLEGRVEAIAPSLFMGGSAFPGGDGTLEVNEGALLDITGPATNRIGVNGIAGTLHVNQGEATLAGDTELGVSSTSGSTGLIVVEGVSSGPGQDHGKLTLDNLQLGGSIVGAAGRVEVINSALVQQNGSASLTIGGSAGAGEIYVANPAGTVPIPVFQSGTGPITLHATGTIHVDGGTFSANGFVDFQGGALDLDAGSFVAGDGFDVRSAGGTLDFSGGTLIIGGGTALLPTSFNFGGTDPGDPPTLQVQNGAVAEVQFAVRPGRQTGERGEVRVLGAPSGGRSILRGTGGGAGADLLIGQHGHGDLEVVLGGLASFQDDFVLGEQPTGSGSAVVSGVVDGFRSTVDVTNGSNTQVNIGREGVGELDVRGGALVQTGGDVYLAAISGDATATVSGSSGGFDATLQSGDDLWVAGASSAPGGAAELNIESGGRVVVPDLMRVYGGGTVNLDGGTLDVGRVEFQGGAGLAFASGAVHFHGDATVDAALRDGLFGAGEPIAANQVLSVADTLTLSDPLTLDGGELSIRLGANVDTNLNFVSGTLTLNDSQLNVASGGLLGGSVAVGANQTIHNTGATLVDVGASLQVNGGDFHAAGPVTIAALGAVEVATGDLHAADSLLVKDKGILENHARLVLTGDLTVETGATAANSGILEVEGASSDSSIAVAGAIDNQGEIRLTTGDIVTPADGLTLTGGGTVNGPGHVEPGLPPVLNFARLQGEPGAVINNIDNRIESTASRFLVTDLTLENGEDAEIGDRVTLQGVAMSGGAIVGADVLARSSSETAAPTVFNGLVRLPGALRAENLVVPPTSELRVESGGELEIVGLSLNGGLRAEEGSAISVSAITELDLSNGQVSLADDALHSVLPSTTVEVGEDFTFDNLTVGENPSGFVPNLYGAEPVVATGQTLTVLNSTTLSQELRIEGGTFATGFLDDYANLVLQSGEFHLTQDDFIVGPGGAGPRFQVGTGATLTVDEKIEIAAGDRLIVSGGEVHGGGASGSGLSNSGDLDLVEGSASFAGSPTNAGDINAIDSTLSFPGELLNTGQLNLINTTVNGAVHNSGSVALAGDNTFTGKVSGAGDFTGGGTARFEGALAPGASAAEVAFEGDVQLAPTARLEIEVRGATPGSEFDVLSVAGAAHLGGELVVSLLDDFVPQLGDTFEIITASEGLAGTFATETFAAFDPNLEITAIYGAQSVQLAVAPALAGDYNADGVVDAADYAVWRDSLGGTSNLAADGDRSGTIDEGDYTVWRANYGVTSSAAASSTATNPAPEPTSLMLLSLGAMATGARRMQNRRHPRRRHAPGPRV